MTKPKFETPDMTQRNIDKISQMFPNCITETKDENGKLKKAVNFELLQQMLSDEIADKDEAYEFTWVGKKAAIVEANKPIRKTLRPCKEESVNWDTTENLYIEGDNLEVLKLLQESYLKKVNIIYIDPPYNTGHDFIYPDSFIMDNEEYNEGTGYFDENGNVNYSRENSSSAGKYHSDWCSMIYSRLLLSKNLLAEDGVLFISIGQEEIHNLINIANEVFGERNQLGIISHQMKAGGGTQGKYFAHNVDYILCYANKYDYAPYFKGEMSDDLIQNVYNQIETEGERKGEYYRSMGLYQSSLGVRPSLRYYIQCPDGSFVIPPGETFPEKKSEGITVKPVSTDGVWRWSYELFRQEKAKGNIEFKKTSKGTLIDENGNPSKWNIYTKIWLKDRQEEGTIPSDFLGKFENRHSSKELSALDIPFDFAKPVELIKYLLYISQQKKQSIILDFFSGSATTAHAVMRLNAEDGGKRKFIMVQLPETTDEKSEAYKAGYKNICEIGKERIRRAGQQILNEKKSAKDVSPEQIRLLKTKEQADLFTASSVYEENDGALRGVPAEGVAEKPKALERGGDFPHLDIGFRVLKVDDSNMKDVYYSASEYDQSNLDMFASNIKEDRNDLDLLFGCLLDWGLPLSLPYTSETMGKFTVHTYNDGDLVACFNEDVSEEVVKEIARKKPLRAVFRDSSFSNSASKINVFEIFKMISPETSVKVI